MEEWENFVHNSKLSLIVKIIFSFEVHSKQTQGVTKKAKINIIRLQISQSNQAKSFIKMNGSK